ncbi:hypothetical protein [Ralstonia phage vB_RsoP_BMB50]|uniref:Uncharacterized protein n=1 Tax=Ralstonia phage vB_RsoP_BMB50 TaxID=2834269 RepID=A0A8E5KHE3_9CAUD|nr:hypothetical protein [Ralstonia phage vB_RsoP_BMB50]
MSAHPFKVGDKVICVDATHRSKITQGGEYTIDRTFSTGGEQKHFVALSGIYGDFFAKRFKLKEQDVAKITQGQDAIVVSNDPTMSGKATYPAPLVMGIRHFVKPGTRVRVLSLRGGEALVEVYNKAEDFLDSPRSYAGQTISLGHLRPADPPQAEAPAKKPAKAATPKPAPTARWYVIRAGVSVIKSNLESRQEAIDYIEEHGSPGSKYIVAKETGEFEVSKKVTEV